MHVMEGRVGSGVLKKKSSSGCLIIKKASASKNSGVGLGGLGDSSKGKKRARLIASGSDSSSSSSESDDDESLEFMRRKVNEKRLKKGSTGYRRNEHDREDGEIDASAEKKRSRLDLFEFDEYDEFDMNKMRNEFLQDRYKRVGRNDGGDGKESSVDKRKQGSYYNGSSSGRSKNVGGSGMKDKGFRSEDDEAHMPISLLKTKYRETAGESIRLQGKNGVLKVMVNKKKKMDFPSQHKSHDLVEKDLSAELPDSKTPKSRGSLVGKERSAEKEKGEVKLEKGNPISNKKRKGKDSGDDEIDTVLKLSMPRPQASSKKAVKKEADKSQRSEIPTPVKGKEGKEGNLKRGGSTEKQMLREKIRGMLIDSGWSIDYRPRRNRDYLDAVYISPSGTAYWSIVKAYDAFKKHLEEENDKVIAEVGSPSFAPLSEDLINKLTRQTKKKIADEMRRKRKEDSMAKSAKKSVAKESEESSDSDQSQERLSSYMKQSQKLRGKLSKVDQDSDDESSDGSPDRKPRKVKFEKTSSISMQGRTSKVIGRCTLLVRGSDRGNNSDFDGYIPYKGKRTVLAWLIDCGTAKSSEKVQYMNRRRTKVMLEGWITRDGIHCGCCSKILTVSKFELHAGSKLRQPFQNIFLESGSSLLQCQIDAWNSQEESLHRDFFTVDVDGDDPDDDTCAICGDGGDLICCDSCPSTFHQICLGIKMLPSGDWHCPNCICKFCGLAGGNIDEENNDELNRCNFCEKKYHKSCSERVYPQPVRSCSASFCGLKCQEIYDHLQKILGIKHELEAGISWSFIQRTDVSDPSERGFPLRVECNSKLAVALSVMDECFLPIIDRRSGINIIHNVVYNCGSNFNRLNYRGFYTAVLERGDEILAAASIRFRGDRLVEMPFIGTRDIYRRQGMCRRLLSAIETELSTLKVGQLIIPAISEHMNTWTTAFGFDELEDTHKKEIKSMNMVVFPGIDMLQKELVKLEKSDGAVATESTKNQPPSPALVEKSEASEQNKGNSSDSEGGPMSKSCDEAGAVDPDSPTPAIPLDALQETDSPAPKISDALQETENPAPNKRNSSDSEGGPISKSCDEAGALDSDSPTPAIPSDALQETDSPAPKTSDALQETENPAPNKRNSSDAEEGPMAKSSGEAGALDSDSPTPAIPSEAVLETDSPAPKTSDALQETENPAPNKRNSSNSEGGPISKSSADSGTANSAIAPSIEIGVPDSSEKADIGNACITEDAGAMNSADAPSIGNGVPDSSEKAAIEESCKVEDAGTINPTDAPAIENGVPCSSENSSEVSKTVSNGCLESHPASVSEASAEDNNGGSNGDEGERVVADSDQKAFSGDGEIERPSPPISPSQALPQNAAATE